MVGRQAITLFAIGFFVDCLAYDTRPPKGSWREETYDAQQRS